jgi:plasmid stabilization system protein ParE
MVKIIWTERSLLDIEDIAEYIARDSLKYAKLTVSNIINSISKKTYIFNTITTHTPQSLPAAGRDKRGERRQKNCFLRDTK